MRKHLTLDQVKDILLRRAFVEFISAEEDQGLECKSAPYLLKDLRQKLELAKDVSAFANSNPGIILLGVQTNTDPTHKIADVVVGISPFLESLLPVDAYYAVLRESVYP
jgi:predicted HTH transcriptional regulator